MKNLVTHMAQAIVDYPDQVVVTEEMAEDHIVYHLTVADSDMGKVIGKQGRIANAMRTLLKVAAIRRGTRAILEIGEGVSPRGIPPRASGAPGFEARPTLDAEPELEPELEPQLEPQLEAELEPELEPELESELEPEPDLELEPEP
jgi:predicted RNA-binding protein YlqC (UPF0109 family)